jgi:hypothetical protein
MHSTASGWSTISSSLKKNDRLQLLAYRLLDPVETENPRGTKEVAKVVEQGKVPAWRPCAVRDEGGSR